MADLFEASKINSVKPATKVKVKKVAKAHSSYSAKDIEVLEGLEPVRLRPGMYIGGTDEHALHHLVAEILDNSMDEAVAGHASHISINLSEDYTVNLVTSLGFGDFELNNHRAWFFFSFRNVAIFLKGEATGASTEIPFCGST